MVLPGANLIFYLIWQHATIYFCHHKWFFLRIYEEIKIVTEHVSNGLFIQIRSWNMK